MVRRRAAATILAITLAAAAPAAAQEPAEPRLGVNVNRVMNDAFDGQRWDLHLSAVRADGIDMVRSDAFWHLVEDTAPQNGVHSYGWDIVDYYAATFARHGLRWQPIIDYSATWAADDPNSDIHAPPRDNTDYAAYAGAFAERYGRGGTFWAAHPELPEVPVTTYEIWNEPNLKWFWLTGPDPARYADMYLRARAAIRAHDPQARVVTGGLAPDGATDFVRAMYAARPELRGQVDGIGLHPYSRSAAGVFGRVRAMRATLEDLGEGGVPMHLTEFGWVTSGQGSAIVAPEAERAALIEQTTDSLVRSDCGVASVIPYTWTTPEQNPDDPEDWYGIVHPDGTRTESSEAYRRVVARYATDPPDPAQPQYVCHPKPQSPFVDTDGDTSADESDADDDNDGVPDAADAFPLDPRDSADADRDGTGDNADSDDDNDGFPDFFDAFPRDAAEAGDADGDGSGDNADSDDDNDGLSDAAEARRHTSPIDRDSDDDGLADGAETRTDPARADSDGDRLPDGLELGRTTGVPDPPGAVAGTDPLRFKRDRDPRSRTRATAKDSDRDGLTDGHEDRDRDGRRDSRETDPHKRDTDGDRVSDKRDRRPLNRRRR
jgi:hypothetical protein